MAKTGRQSFQQMVRLTDELRDRLKAEAEANNRSMNAEIVARLEHSFEFPTGPYAPDIVKEVLERIKVRDDMLRDLLATRDENLLKKYFEGPEE